MTHRTLAIACAALAWFAQGRSPVVSDPAIHCGQCEAWNRPQAPFRVFGNTYYVGTAGLSAVLVTSDNGLILLDGALPQSALLIDGNIRALGFRTEDIRLIVNSHAHYDHAGSIAAFQRATGAIIASSPAGARALELGRPVPDDPQADSGAFPSVKSVRVVADGETLRVGTLALTAHFTPGHTPGSTTWTWQSCEGSKCLNVVYADSLNSVSLPGFRFTGDATYPKPRRVVPAEHRKGGGPALRHSPVGASRVLTDVEEAGPARQGAEHQSLHRYQRLSDVRRGGIEIARSPYHGRTLKQRG